MPLPQSLSFIEDAARSLHAEYGTEGLVYSFALPGLAFVFGLINLSFLGAWYYYVRGNRASRSKSETQKSASGASSRSCDTSNDVNDDRKTSSKPSSSDTDDTNGNNGDQQLRNVFSVKQASPQPRLGGKQKLSSFEEEAKPFDSSYYFAHNNSKSQSRYNDGLKPEDYVMNGPRLLSKGGVSVGAPTEAEQVSSSTETGGPSSNSDVDAGSGEASSSETSSTTTPNRRKSTAASTPIARYLWDDDGSSDVAKIHIDTLPSQPGRRAELAWEKAGATKDFVEVRLVGDGLFVGIMARTSTIDGAGVPDRVRYHLHVRKMYGKADSVKAIVKKHKLLIKIRKKRVPKGRRASRASNDDNGGGIASNLGKLWNQGEKEEDSTTTAPAWPRLSASSTGGTAATDVDEDLFRRIDSTGDGGGEDLLG